MWWLALALLGVPTGAWSQVKGDDRHAIRKMVYQKIYLRTDVPSNRGGEPFLEISPTGYSSERLVGLAEAKAGAKRKASGVYWPFRPNDWVKWGKQDYVKNRITVWFEGEEEELKVTFIEIGSLEDFKKAFHLVFSNVPLQDENPDWPAEVKSAIVLREVVEGMTKQQAACSVGTPLKIELNGTSEAWYPRQQTGYVKRPGTGLPKKLEFEGDKLVRIEK